MKKVRRESAEVLYCEDELVLVDAGDLAELERLARSAPRGRARICAHRSPSDPLHEMVIAVDRKSYIRPHRHLARTESFHVIAGAATVLLFGDDGSPRARLPLGDPGSGRAFYFRLDRPLFHALLVESAAFLFHEIALGPFDPAGSQPAPWSPEDRDPEAGRAFLADALRRLEERP